MMKYFTLSLVMIICYGCTSQPSQFIVNTTPNYSNNTSIKNNVNILVTDLRAKQDILQTTKKNKISYLPAQLPTTTLIEDGLNASFKMHHSTRQFTTNLINVNVEKMGIKLNQSNFSYDTKTLIQLAVTIKKDANTLHKVFKRHGASKGQLKADIAVLEQDFNHLLQLVFNDISQDPQVIEYLTQ